MLKIRTICFIFTLLAIGWLSPCLSATSPVYIEIKGLNAPLAQILTAQLSLSLSASKHLMSADDLHKWCAQNTSEIKKILASYGYFKPEIFDNVFSRNHTWNVIYQVKPGPVLKITRLDLAVKGEGSNDLAIKKIILEQGLIKGTPFVSENYENFKQQLLNTALSQGYLSARFTQHRVLINQRAYTAEIKLLLDTGPRYYFGSVIFKQHFLSNSLLQRFIPFKESTPYSSDQLLKLQDNLYQSGYFKKVIINDPIKNKKNTHIPTVLTLVPRPSQQYSAGIGYSTDVRLRGTLGWESRRLNRWGHKFSITSQLAKIQRSLQATYTIPGKNPNLDSYNLNFAIVRKQLSQVTSTTQQLGVTSVSHWKGWQRNLFLNYQIERFNYTNKPYAFSHLLTPGISFTRSQFDNPNFAFHGFKVALRFQGAKKDLLSNTDFLQMQLQAKKILSWNKESRLILSSDFGYTWAPDLKNFPPSLLFYAGGSQSLRGYNYQELGPGRYLVLGSAEYQHRLFHDIYGAVFFDMGNAVNSFPINLQKGAGVGVLWASPLGPMEVTLGKALSLPGHPFRVQFSMGIDLL